MRMGLVVVAVSAGRYLPIMPVGTTVAMAAAALVCVGAGRLLATSEKLALAGRPEARALRRFGRGGLCAALLLCAVAVLTGIV